MKNLSTVLDYHNRTKHHSHKYAASLGYMDWETQPNPFRTYQGTENVPLLFSHIDPPYHLLFEADNLPKAPTCLESLSHLLRYSLGLAAWKQQGTSSWALRCNASSGNLHPTECYVIAPPTPGLSESYTLTHYAPKTHTLEVLHTFDMPVEGMGNNGYLLILSSVIWREAWKYGERCWRYCQLDAGHAQEALRLSAKSLGWNSSLLGADTSELTKVCGLDQLNRFHLDELESADMMLWVSPDEAPTALTLPNTPQSSPNCKLTAAQPPRLFASSSPLSRSLAPPAMTPPSQRISRPVSPTLLSHRSRACGCRKNFATARIPTSPQPSTSAH